MTSFTRRYVVQVAVALAVTACGEPNTRGHRSKGGTSVVHSTVPIYGDTAVLEEVARIGSPDGPLLEILSGVTAFAALSDGSVVAADDFGLRVFSAAGASIETLAQKGAGPGETSFVVGISGSPDSVLYAVDLGNRRINVYRRRDGSVDHWPLPEGMPGNGRTSIAAQPDGGVLITYNPPVGGGDVSDKQLRPILIRLNGNGETTDTVMAPEQHVRDCPTNSSALWRSGFYEDLREPYFPKLKWAMSSTGDIAIGCPLTYAFEVVKWDGSIIRISREWNPVRVSSQEQQAFVDGQEFAQNRSGYFQSWSWQGPKPPSAKPAYHRIMLGEDGRIWVWPSQPSVERPTSPEARMLGAPSAVYTEPVPGSFDVFTADGQYLGVVRPPPAMSYAPFPGRADPYVMGDTLWGISHDSLDVEYLSKYVIRWPIAANGR